MNDGLAMQNGNIGPQSDMFAVDGEVRGLVVRDDKLYVGGDFRITSPSVQNLNVIRYEVDYNAIWHGHLWTTGLEDLFPIHSMDLMEDEKLVVTGVTIFSEPKISIEHDSYDWLSTWYIDVYPDQYHGVIINPFDSIVSFIPRFIVYGSPSITDGKGVVPFVQLIGSGGTRACNKFNDDVRAGAYYKGNYYFGGDFSEISYYNNVEYHNQLVFSNSEKLKNRIQHE